MAKILIATTGLTGILNASLELSRRLTQAGHQVIMAAPNAKGEQLATAGIPFFELPLIQPYRLVYPAGRRKLQKLIFGLSNRSILQSIALEVATPRAFIELLEEQQPDLLLIDVELPEYIMAAYGHAFPCLLLSQWYSLWPAKDLPYLMRSTIPGQGKAGSSRAIRYDWWKVKWQRKWMFWRKRLLSFGTDRRSTLFRLADAYDFPKHWIRQNYWPGPVTYTELPVLSMTPYEMEFPHQMRPNLHYVGPMVNTERPERPAVSLAGMDIDEIIQRAEAQGQRIILCTLSTMQASGQHFIEKLRQAVAGQPDWCLIISLGGKGPVEVRPEQSANTHIFQYVPQLKVLSSADLSINHGGIHTIHECIEYEVPMLVYSGQLSDQNGCAARVHFHGLGIMADRDADDATAIWEKITSLLKDDSYRQRVVAMKEKTAHYAANKVVEKLVAIKNEE
ncbi:MAG: nucleotide disphospho-sugar-binding domain-containing protein [Bacteroidota bacterium]